MSGLRAALLAAVILAAESSAARAAPAPDADALFAAYATTATPGCAVAAARGGRTVLERAYGSADLEHDAANSVQTIFEAGSASKQVTAAALLLLVRDGVLSLDDDVRKHVPELPAYGAPITLRHLLHHTSGLRDWRYVAGLAGERLGARVHSNLDALAIAARQKTLNHAPGAEHAYTNTGYSLMALVIERASGKSLQAFSRERLFEPLGMSSSRWRDDFRHVVRGRAVAYSRAGTTYRQDMPFENAYGAGGLLTTAGDLLRWTEALRTDRLKLRTAMEQPGVLNDARPIAYAGGLFVDRYRGARQVWHSGQTAGYSAWTGYYPEHQVSVVVLCNAGDADPARLGRGVADGLLPSTLPADGDDEEDAGDSAEPAEEGEPWRPSPADLAAVAGRYRSDEARVVFDVKVEEGRLRLRVDGRDAPPFTLSPTYRDRFVFMGGGAGVIRDGQGRVIALSLDLANLRDFRLHRDPR